MQLNCIRQQKATGSEKKEGKEKKTAATATISLFSSSVCQAARPTTNNQQPNNSSCATCNVRRPNCQGDPPGLKGDVKARTRPDQARPDQTQPDQTTTQTKDQRPKTPDID